MNRHTPTQPRQARKTLGIRPMVTPPEKIKKLRHIRRMWPGTSCDVQRLRIRTALSLYALNTYEIQRYLDCYDPPARIWELRHLEQTPINMHRQIVETEAGERHRVGVYVLAPAVTDPALSDAVPRGQGGEEA